MRVIQFFRAMPVINADGYRPNVGIILSNQQGQVLWARRIGQRAWQFPQGGMAENETPVEAMYREMAEEIGLQPDDVRIIGYTRDWLRYQLPQNLIRHHQNPFYIGQKQIWFLLRLLASEDAVKLDLNAKPEFDRWRWVNYWEPLNEVVAFKREVYEQALRELAPLISQKAPDATVSVTVVQPAKTSSS